MFTEGSAYNPLLKYMYDRHASNYIAIPHSNFKPYATVKTPVPILQNMKK
jgi:hypothetical protein